MTAAPGRAAGRGAAYFDVDGTILDGNIVRYLVHLRTRGMGRARRALWTLGYLPQVARWLALDRLDRGRMNREFYRGYAGMDAAATRRAAEADYATLLGRRVFPAARAAVSRHRAEGRPVVLLTGSLDFLVAPLARDLGVDEALCPRMEERDGRLTGRLLAPPLAGEEKARMLREHAAAGGLDLAASWGYADSIADLPMLEAVGHPRAVNADRRLARVARERGWPSERWARTG